MRTRKTLKDKNAEEIIRMFEEASKLGWLSSKNTKLNYKELMKISDSSRMSQTALSNAPVGSLLTTLNDDKNA